MAIPIAGVGTNPFGSLVEKAGNATKGGGGFGQALGDALKELDASQADADTQAQALATGKATDLSSVVMSVEKASLEVQLATQVRSKSTDAFNEIMRMQV
ncbi:MAG TPA: flagellar hook-basal body complex protein FliE [Gaiellaceae bacterium]|jgi:flagellar hook-basal body complex protein FliE|nr:flagellar hook-basal body complex protein FliE [Gaiellaceae bacterium]